MVFVSIVAMFSASSYLVSRSGSIQGPILRHATFHLAGFFVILFVQLISFKWLKFIGYVMLVASLLLLVFTMVFGVEQAGAARFISLGGFQFQPSEVAKVALLLVVASQVEFMQDAEYQRKYYKVLLLFIYATCGLIFLENLSTAAILFTVIMIMMWIGEVKFSRLFWSTAVVVILVGIIIGMAAIIPEETYQQSDNKVVKMFGRAYTWVSRIENFVDSDDTAKFEINDDNYQAAHAKIAIARGGFFPHMPGSSIQRNFLPEAFSDYIFAIIVEEGGLLGGVIVIILYLILLYRAGVVARRADSIFGAVLVIGVTLLIVIQAFIHVCVATGFGPVTGQPLPLISRGGTSTLTNCFYIGLIINVTNQMKKRTKQQPAADVAVNEEQITN